MQGTEYYHLHPTMAGDCIVMVNKNLQHWWLVQIAALRISGGWRVPPGLSVVASSAASQLGPDATEQQIATLAVKLSLVHRLEAGWRPSLLGWSDSL